MHGVTIKITWTVISTQCTAATYTICDASRYVLLYIVTNLFLIKSTRRTKFPDLFCYKTLHISGISFAHHQEFSTVHSALVYFMQFWLPFPSRVRAEHPDSAWKRLSETCMKITSAEFTVENSWWWAEKIHEKFRIL